MTIQALLGAPNPDDPLDEDRRDMWNYGRGGERTAPSNPEPSEEYKQMVIDWKEEHAMGGDDDEGDDDDDDDENEI